MRTVVATIALLVLGGCAGTLEIDRRGGRKRPDHIAVVTRADPQSADGCAAALPGRGQVVRPDDLVAALRSASPFFAALAERLQAQAVITLKIESFVKNRNFVAFVTAEWIDPVSGEILALGSVAASFRDELSFFDAGKRACAALVEAKN